MIKKRNLDPELIQWIQNFSGLGPGIGDIKYVVPAQSATSAYRGWLESQGVSSADMFLLPSEAYAAVEANRNDVILLYPGTYTEEANISWAKAQTHMIGVGNPTWRQGGKIRINATVEAVTKTITIAASGCFMGGFGIQNSGAFATSLTPLALESTYFAARNLDLRGHLDSAVAGIELAASLVFGDGSSYGFGSNFDECNIGTGSGAVRTANGATTNGVILFGADSQLGSPAAYTHFEKCSILSRAETAATAMVKVMDGRWSHDRYVKFDDCLFFNFDAGNDLTLTGAFYFKVVTRGSGTIILRKCTAFGIDEWVTQDSGHVQADMPIVGTGGGICQEAVGTSGS